MTGESRFLTGFREIDTDHAGLVLEDDGTVWLVNPDGTRTQLPGGGGGSQPFATVEIDPGPPEVYGLLIQALAGFADVFNAYIRVLDENGVEIFNIDNGGIDIKSPPGGGASVSLSDSDTSYGSSLSSRGLTLLGEGGGAFVNITDEFGIRIVSGTPPTVVGPEFCQIYYDSTPGAAKLVIRAKDSDGTLVSGEVALT